MFVINLGDFINYLKSKYNELDYSDLKIPVNGDAHPSDKTCSHSKSSLVISTLSSLSASSLAK